MASMSGFFDTVAFVNARKKNQLVEIADHYGVVIAERSCKDELRTAILFSLIERGLINTTELGGKSGPMTVVQAASLTFEQQKELLALQLGQEKMRQDTEKIKLELEHTRLQLIRGQAFSWEIWDDGSSMLSTPGEFDVAANLRLV